MRIRSPWIVHPCACFKPRGFVQMLGPNCGSTGMTARSQKSLVSATTHRDGSALWHKEHSPPIVVNTRINKDAGRDHWPQCGFSLLFGGGVKQGYVHGTTDKLAAWPTSHPVSPPQFVATIYKLLGIDPHLTVPDRLGRPIPIAHGGEAVAEVIA
mgnify:CR=1 FL=1